MFGGGGGGADEEEIGGREGKGGGAPASFGIGGRAGRGGGGGRGIRSRIVGSAGSAAFSTLGAIDAFAPDTPTCHEMSATFGRARFDGRLIVYKSRIFGL